MSTRRDDYVLLGMMLTPEQIEKFPHEKLELFMDAADEGKTDTLVCVNDGMSGKYSILGMILQKVTEGEGVEPLVIDTSDRAYHQKVGKVWMAIEDLFYSVGLQFITVADIKPIVLTHWH